MSAKQLRLIAGIGLAAVVSFVVAFAVDPTPPTAGSPASAVLAHQHEFTNLDRLAGFLFGLSGSGLLAYTAGLRHWLAGMSNGPRWWATAMLAGGVTTATALIITAGTFFTLASHSLSGDIAASEAATLATLYNDAINYGFVFGGFGVVVLVSFLAALLLASGRRLRLLGLLGALAAALQVPYLVTAFFTSGPLAAGGIVTIIGFGTAGLFLALTALAVLRFAPAMQPAAH